MTTDAIKAIEALETKLGEKFETYEGMQKESGEVSKAVKADLQKMSEDYKQMEKELTTVNDVLNSIQQKGVKHEDKPAHKTMGQQFTESDAFKAYKSGEQSKARIELKNTIIGEGGSPQDPVDTIVPRDTMPGIVGGAFRGLRILDVINRGVTSSNQVHYTRENTFTNNAAETAEAAAKAESVLTFEAVDTPVRTIAHFIKVSKQVLDDAPALQSYIDQRMRYGVNLRLEQQIVNGNGTSPNLSGLITDGTALAAISADLTLFDIANRAKYAVIAADYQPDYFMVNPSDWSNVERAKTSTNAFVGQENALGYLNNGLVPTLWGLPVIPSNSVPAGSLICASRDASMYWDRMSTVVEIFDQNQDDVEKNLLTIRAEARGAFTVFRPTAVQVADVSGF